MESLNDSLCLQDLVGGLHHQQPSHLETSMGLHMGPAQPLTVCSPLMTHHRLDNNGIHGQPHMTPGNDHKKRGELDGFGVTRKSCLEFFLIYHEHL